MTDDEADLLLRCGGADGAEAHRWELRDWDHGLLLVLSGHLTCAVDGDFDREALRRIEVADGPALLIDLSACENLASIAFGFLAQYYRSAVEHGRRVLVVRPPPNVEVLLRILGMDHVFDYVSDRGSAAREFTGQG